MRQLIIDTETTGLYPQQGHRIIELAALEVVNRRATGRTVHFRVDPEREIDAGATEVHGMTWEDLKGKPKFRDVAPEFVDFARGARVGHPQRAVRPRVPRRRVRAGAACRAARTPRRRRRHAGARARDVPGQAQQPRRAVRALRHRQRAADAARRAARRAAAGRGLPRDDARAGHADDRHRRAGRTRRRAGDAAPADAARRS